MKKTPEATSLVTEADTMLSIGSNEPTEREKWPSKITATHIQNSGLKKEALENIVYHFFRRANDRYLRNIVESTELDCVAGLANFVSLRKGSEIKIREVIAKSGSKSDEGTVVMETCMPDQRFIIDTIKLCISELGLKEEGEVHFSIPIHRDDTGNLVSIEKKEDDNHLLESITRYVLTGFENDEHKKLFFQKVGSSLEIVAASVRDYQRIRKVLRNAINSYDFLIQANLGKEPSVESLKDANELLEWIMDNNFVYVAAIDFTTSAKGVNLKAEKCLGMSSENFIKDKPTFDQMCAFFDSKSNNKQVFSLQKSSTHSPMKSSGLMDILFLRQYDESGNPEGGIALVGIFTRKALTTQRSSIPYLKSRLQMVMEKDEARPQSSTYNARVKAFNSIMIEYLFESDDDVLWRLINSRLDVESHTEALAHINIIAERKCAYALLAIPQESYSDQLVEKIKASLTKNLGTKDVEVETEAAEGQIIYLAFFLRRCSKQDKSLELEIEKEVINLCTSWHGHLRSALMESGISNWARLDSKYTEAFPSSYKQSVVIQETVNDVLHLEELQKNGKPQFDFLPDENTDAHNDVRLRLYRADTEGLLLSEILPIFHNVGFRVLDEVPTLVTLPNKTLLHIDTFRLLVDAKRGEQDYIASKERLISGLEAIFESKVPSDAMNRLMLRPGLAWQDVDVLRSYMKYSIQIGPFFDSSIVDRILVTHAEMTKNLVDYFHAKFNPSLGDKASVTRVKAVEKIRTLILAGLEKIQDATEDRVFRIFFNLMEATLRTNAFRTDRLFHYISFKFECAKLEHCPEPRPLFEIFVHHGEMEGCHLRSGRVARGGIRWSDRLDDYRTEIFGLMRAQKTKNVLIVPQGAKGGFVVRGTPRAGQTRKQYGDTMYKILIRGLLDITDNQLLNKEIRPPGVVCYDAFDPYLVVAADKGTAHLSDTANGLAADYGFWLGDAFASGGSVGYDHKVEGITAKGAWVCIRHHFEKKGIDPEKDVISVVGIGDMSGDVFGNGMLRSKTIKLVAAFNHAHVFLDPNPDCDASFVERQRMFKLPASGWSDYNSKIISKGGGVYSRSEKSIPLSAEVQKLLGVEEKQLSTEEVIKRLLTLDVDLLYNGGLGTYIKASTEDHRMVGDKTNDPVRVDGINVRAKVVGEGGNMGVTQKGRIEFALKGGLINTDAIDNSGGVDCSDREVNLKILFGPLITSGKMKLEERNKILKSATSEVLDNILGDSGAHALCLSLDEIRSKKDPYIFLWTIDFLSEKGVMVPEREDLPTLKDLQQRGLKNGFTRSELSKLMAFFKMYTKEELLTLEASRFPLREEFLQKYFPKQIYANYQKNISSHLLLRELLGTVWIGHIINDAGASIFTDLITDSERSVQDVAFAYTATENWMDANILKQRILSCKEASLEARLHGLVALENSIKVTASWVLHFFAGETLYERIGDGQNFKPGAEKFRKAFDDINNYLQSDPASASTRQRLAKDVTRLEGLGFEGNLAKEMAYSVHWPKAFPIAYLAEKASKSTKETTDAYIRCGQATGMQDILAKISVQSSVDRWEAQALKSLFTSLRRTNLLLTEKALGIGVKETLNREPALTQIGMEISRLHANPSDPVPISLLVVMAEKLHKAVARL